MRTLALAAVAGVVLTASIALAQQPGEGVAQRVQPDGAQPGGEKPPPLAVQPLPFQPGGQQFDPQAMKEKMQAQMAQAMGLRIPPRGVKWGGASLEPADEVLLDQLNLPAGQGMIVTNVEADSAAEKAGLKKHDLVIKANEKPVAGDAKEMVKALGKNDADTAIDLVVLRKGKEQSLKGVKLPEVALAPAGGFGQFGGPIGPAGIFPPPPGGFPPPLPFDPKLGGPGGFAFPPGGVNINGMKVNITRDKDDFTGTHEKDKVKITIKGKMEDKTAKVSEITITEGETTKKYEKVKDVPEANRDAVDRLIRVINGDPGAILPNPGVLPRVPGGVPNPGLPGAPPAANPAKDAK